MILALSNIWFPLSLHKKKSVAAIEKPNAAKDKMEVSLVAKAKPADIPKKSIHEPGFILLCNVLLKEKPTIAQSIIDEKLNSNISWMKSVAKKTKIGEVAVKSTGNKEIAVEFFFLCKIFL